MGKNRDLIDCDKGIIRFSYGGRVRYGLLTGARLRLYEGSPFAGGKPGKKTAPLEKVKILAPCRPSKVVAIGRNYKAHAEEFNSPLPPEPMVFLKPPSSVIGPGQNIILPAFSKRVDHEAELAVVIGKKCRSVTPEEATDYILGYTCLNDVSARDLQKKDVQWARAKGFDTFCPLGPVIALDIDPTKLRVRALLNKKLKQSAKTSDMIFDVYFILSHVSQVMTLNPGDVIATGTPAGVGPMKSGDVITIEVKGIGRLTNPVL